MSSIVEAISALFKTLFVNTTFDVGQDPLWMGLPDHSAFGASCG